MSSQQTVDSTVDVDYPRTILADTARLELEIAELRSNGEATSVEPRLAGISVIIPSHAGKEHVLTCLDSLARQTFPKDLFEAIVVLNGEPDGSRAIIESSGALLRDIRLRIIENGLASAGEARNIGISAARHHYLTFLDDDDAVEPDFLTALHRSADAQTIVIAPLRDVTDDHEHAPSTLGDRLKELQSRGSFALHDEPWVLGFNACKLIPAEIACRMSYDPGLNSGEDLVFMADLLTVDGLRAVAPAFDGPASYVRTLRADSVSRRADSFDFSVEQRLAVIRSLERIPVPPERASAIDALKTAQAGFVSRFLLAHPGSDERVRQAIESSEVSDFPWAALNKGRAKSLVIAYCFSPFMDTSAVVAAKIVASRSEFVDVISNDMSTIRVRDAAVATLSDRWIDTLTELKVRPAFSDWSLISEFAEEARRSAEEQGRLKGGYEQLYSRALWAGSHVAAALFKLDNWSTEWSAEFSDPLREGVDGEPRTGKIVENDISRVLQRALTDRGYTQERVDTLFDLVELATFALADRVIFTNENQRDAMLAGVVDDRLREETEVKSVVRRHPGPPEHAYKAVESSYRLPRDTINVGYFGAFYRNRSIDEVLVALANLRTAEQRSIRLHVFSNAPDDVSAAAAAAGISSLVYSNKYLSYMNFLNCITRFDCLLVNDAHMAPGRINPFLPSKLSDYRGSGSQIWALVDPGSPLSREQVDHSSPVGDSFAALQVLRALLRAKEISS